MLANANDTPDIEELAAMLMGGEFPENYDHIIRNISDEDLERLWAIFKQKWRGMNGDAHNSCPAPE
jgi:hypothetical protein